MKMFKCMAVIMLLFSFTTLTAQHKKDKQVPFNSNQEFEIQFIRDGVDGTTLFKIFSYGKDEDECIEAAKRNAVIAVIFRGIPGSDLQKPLVTEAGAADKYNDYFTAFFQSKYKTYVAISTDGTIDSNDRLKVGKQIKVGIVVVVQKALLRQELENAGIIKKLGDGF